MTDDLLMLKTETEVALAGAVDLRAWDAVREHGLTSSRFIDGLKRAGIEMDRKVLAAIAYDDPGSFGEIVKKVQAAPCCPVRHGRRAMTAIRERPAPA